MALPHAEHQSSAPLAESLKTVLESAPHEIELAASESFYGDGEDEEGDAGDMLVEVPDQYFQFFRQTGDALSGLLGQAVFNGRLPDAFDWADTLGIEPCFDEIRVWEKDGRNIYLTVSWEDKDCPIVVSLGAS
ncbi:MAG TPA: hypothetical protein VF798_03120 [Burkholderiaceae bacterium]